MKIWLRILFFCFYAPIIFCSVLLLLMTEAQPIVSIPYSIDKKEIQSVKTMFRSVHNRPRNIKALRFTEKNLNNITNYFLKRYLQIATKITLDKHKIAVKITLQLSKNSWGEYLNIAFKLNIEPQKEIVISHLTIGELQIADELTQGVVVLLLQSE